MFKDITPLLARSRARWRSAIRQMAERAERPDAVVAIESRGFIFGAGLALHWSVPFVPAPQVRASCRAAPCARSTRSSTARTRSSSTQTRLRPGQTVAIVRRPARDRRHRRRHRRGSCEQLGARVESLRSSWSSSAASGGRERLADYPVEALLELGSRAGLSARVGESHRHPHHHHRGAHERGPAEALSCRTQAPSDTAAIGTITAI